MSRTILAARKAGLVAPTITAAPVLAWTIGVGTSPAITAPTYTGSPGTITYTLKRDGVNVAGVVDVSEATLEAYVTDTAADGTGDIGPSMTVVATVTNAAGSDSDTSNAIVYDDAARLPNTAIWISTDGVTTADAGATINDWASTLGGVSCTITAPASGNRPAHNATGGAGSRPLITTDGTDDVLYGTLTKGSAWDTYELGLVGSRVAFGSTGDRWWTYFASAGGTTRFSLQDNNVNTFRLSVTAGANTASTSDPDGVTAHYSGDASPTGASSNQIARKNGTAETTSVATTTSRADGAVAAFGAATDGTAAANLTSQGLHMGPALTTDQRTEIRALLSYHTGIAC